MFSAKLGSLYPDCVIFQANLCSMRTYSLLFTLFTILIAGQLRAENKSFDFAGIKVELCDSATGGQLNNQPDMYTRLLTPFDLLIRLHKEAKEADYLAFAAKQTQNWTQEEQDILVTSFKEIDAYLIANNIKLKLPKTLQMIKTRSGEEFGAEGYTRGSRIMLNPAAQKIDLHLVAHELFHVISRFDEKRRDDIYKVFGFEKCSVINYANALKGRVITNPDCPLVQHYVVAKAGGVERKLTLVLYSKKEYNERYTLADYANVGLLELTGDEKHMEPVMKDGSGIVYELQDAMDVFNKIGTNTQYVLHPEEIAAEHFAMLVAGGKVNQIKFVDGVKEALKK